MGTFGNTFGNTFGAYKASDSGIPNSSEALFWLDGVIVTDGPNKYFRDRTINNRDFLITNYDFDSGWASGFPYKSAATISAPAGDTALISADINNFLYASNGTPNQIPVVSFFQDIDYEHKLFSKHSAQVLNVNDVETEQPKITEIALYNSVRSGAKLTNCQTYFEVPTENTSTSVWLSPTGNDTTGDGSKNNPYRSLIKIQATTKSIVYLKTGNYDTTTTYANFTGATALTLQSLGYVSWVPYTVTYGAQVNRDLVVNNFIIPAASATYTFWATQGLEFNSCKVTGTNSVFVIARAGMETKDCKFKHCNIECTGTSGFFRSSVSINSLVLDTCIGTSKVQLDVAISSFVIKHSKMSGTVGPYTLLDTQWTGSLTSRYVNYSTITGTLTLSPIDGVYCKNSTITSSGGNTETFQIKVPDNSNFSNIQVTNNTFSGSNTSSFVAYVGTTTETGVNGIHGLIFTGNKIENRNTSVGTTHTVFIGGGINQVVKYNKISCYHGYGIVVKSGDVAYTTTDAHISYNIFDFNNSIVTYAILAKGISNINICNNTIINMSGGFIFGLDGYVPLSSATYLNNLVDLSGNTNFSNNAAPTGTLTLRNNVVNKNGFTCTPSANNYETNVSIDANAVPASKIEQTEIISGSNNTGLASNYVIPTSVTYQNQASTWQNGAVILP